MKGVFLALAATIGILILIGTFVGENKAQPAKAASPGAAGVKNADGVEFFVVGSNAENIARYEAKRTGAEQYLGEVIAAVDELLAMNKLPEGAALAAQSRKMNALADKGDVFGAFVGPNFSYLHECRSTGIAAASIWNVMAGFITTETAVSALERFNNHVRGECQIFCVRAGNGLPLGRPSFHQVGLMNRSPYKTAN